MKASSLVQYGTMHMRKRYSVLIAALLTLALCVSCMTALAESAADGAAVSDAKKGDWRNILLLGADAGGPDGGEPTDVMIILSVNATQKKAKMTSILRDTRVSYPGISGQGKINAANVYGGPELAVATVNDCFDADIRNYVLVDMAGLIRAVDQIGGVDVAVSAAEQKLVNAYVQDFLGDFGAYSGETAIKESGDSVHLNGLLTMAYCRATTGTDDSELTQRRRNVLRAGLVKIKACGAVELAGLISSVLEDVKTDMSLMDLVSLADVGLGIDVDSIERFHLPADGTYESVMTGGVLSIKPDFDANKARLHDFLYGPGL